MRKIILILISVAIFFTDCTGIQKESPEPQPETTVPTQIAQEEDFGGVTFGMTRKEILDTIGRQPDNEVDEIIWYYEDVYFHESYGIAPKSEYHFDDNDILHQITCYYIYELDGSEQEQIETDYAAIKKELFERYPIEICTDFHENEENAEMTLDTKNRHISVFYDDFYIIVSIESKMIDHSENFDSITLGMTEKEVIEIVGGQPVENPGVLGFVSCSYDDELCFNVDNADVQYNFKDDMLYRIQITYFYPSEEEQLSIDFATIKEELLNSYPEETRRDFQDKGTELSFYAKDAYVTLSSETYADLIMVTIENKEKYLK